MMFNLCFCFTILEASCFYNSMICLLPDSASPNTIICFEVISAIAYGVSTNDHPFAKSKNLDYPSFYLSNLSKLNNLNELL